MPIYITRGRYSSEAMKSLVAKPENREPAVRKHMESMGCKLLAFYVTMGEFDWMTIVDAPSGKDVAAGVAAVAATGSVVGSETVEAFTGSDAMQIFSSAKKSQYRPPGVHA
jgi:uncharacterized protein with GYD domain